MMVTVGVSDMKASADPEDTLITYSLGSCVGVALFDPANGVGGLLHCMLPLSRLDPAKADLNPCMFVDTGVAALMEALLDKGARRGSLFAKVAGGSKIMDEDGIFDIGLRNCAVLRKLLRKNNIPVSGEDVGGTVPRTMRLHIGTGRTVLRMQGREVEI
jgi:chemotaxis protein CheD